MDYIHTRKNDDRVEIGLNARFQPIHSKTKVITQLSNFLGTIGRSVPLDYVSWLAVPDKDKLWEYVQKKYIIPEKGKQWVLKTMNDAWRVNKARIKANHYKRYDNDEDRLKNRPTDIPLDVFKVLLDYWGDATVKEKAETNATSRSCIHDTHTAGPISFAQISNVMKIQNPDHISPTKADVFVETRKRTEGHTYKIPDVDVLKFRLSKIKDLQKLGGDVEPLISGDTSHADSWLIGRHVNTKKVKRSPKQVDATHSDDYVNDLIAKI